MQRDEDTVLLEYLWKMQSEKIAFFLGVREWCRVYDVLGWELLFCYESWGAREADSA